jgi:hypothetical protein
VEQPCLVTPGEGIHLASNLRDRLVAQAAHFRDGVGVVTVLANGQFEDIIVFFCEAWLEGSVIVRILVQLRVCLPVCCHKFLFKNNIILLQELSADGQKRS